MAEPQDRNQHRRFDIGLLPRLLLWAGAAACALAFVVLAANSETGGKRWAQAREALLGPPKPPETLKPAMPTVAQLLARSQDAEAQARRLAEAVRVLSADRDRLMERIAALERTVEDVTGSITAERQEQREPIAEDRPITPVVPSASTPAPVVAAAAPQSTAAADPAPVVATAPAPPNAPAAATPKQPPPVLQVAAATAAPPPGAAVPTAASSPAIPITNRPQVASDNRPADTPRPPPEPAAAQPISPAPAWMAALATQPLPPPPPEPPAQVPRPPPANTTAARAEYAVDVGGAANIDTLRGVWLAAKDRHSSLESLRPLVAIRDNGKQPGPTEFRLVMGPLPTAAAAAKLCASLSAARITCYPTVYEGQRVAWR